MGVKFIHHMRFFKLSASGLTENYNKINFASLTSCENTKCMGLTISTRLHFAQGLTRLAVLVCSTECKRVKVWGKQSLVRHPGSSL